LARRRGSRKKETKAQDIRPVIDHESLKNQLKLAWYSEPKDPLMILGPPGIGKSQVVGEQFANEISEEFWENSGRDGKIVIAHWNKLTTAGKKKVFRNPQKYFIVVDIRLAQYKMSDLSGIPDLSKDIQSVVWRPPRWLRTMSKPGAAGIIFLDEINQAPKAVQAAAYQLILDRGLGTMSLSKDVMVVAAGNRVQDRTNVFSFPHALSDRFSIVELSAPGYEGWKEWAVEAGIHPSIIAFIKQHEDMLYDFDPDEIPSNTPYATPRSYEKISDKIKAWIRADPEVEHVRDILNDEQKRQLLSEFAAARIGAGKAAELVGFLDIEEEFPKVEKILHDPSRLSKRDLRMANADVTVSFLSSLAQHYRRAGNKTDFDGRKKLFKKIMKIAKTVAECSKEYAALFIKFVNSLEYPENWGQKVYSWAVANGVATDLFKEIDWITH